MTAVSYQVRLADLHAHLYQVTLTVIQPQALQTLSLPVWIPGSYLVREFSKNLQRLEGQQGGQTVQLTQLDKCSWQAHCATDQPLVLSYEVYALDNSVRTAWLDTQRGFFNGSSLFLQVHGQQDAPHELELIAAPSLPSWQVATGLTPVKIGRKGFGRYRAANYDELVDCPVEMGDFWTGNFTAGGIPHRFVVAGAPPSFDGARLLADTKTICEAAIGFWHSGQAGARAANPAPHASYLFMLNAVADGYGGLEHRNSTALICKRQDLPRKDASPAKTDAAAASGPVLALSEGYTTLLGLISHEYFHTWNVKQLRPAEFATYDYSQENYTELLWFFEGFTSYYDELLLRRAGLIDDTTYLKLLGKTVNQVLQTPGRKVQSVAQASFDAWVKYYRQDENTPNATVSYYTKGALVALCLDLTLRHEGKGALDDVMRGLWLRCGGPMTQADLAAVLQAVAGRSYTKELARWVHGTAELPLQPLLEQHGVQVLKEPAALAQALGLRVAERAGIQIKMVLRGGAAEQAGFAAGDEWLGLTVGTGKAAARWRLNKLDDVLLYAATATKVSACVARDQRLLELPLVMPRSVTSWRLLPRDKPLLGRWLNAP